MPLGEPSFSQTDPKIKPDLARQIGLPNWRSLAASEELLFADMFYKFWRIISAIERRTIDRFGVRRHVAALR
jgi:hypothetical protein